MEIVAIGSNQVARPLRVLVPLIKADLEHAVEAGMPYYTTAGEKMIEAREQMTAAEFDAWCQRNFKVGRRQAIEYMNLARHNSGSGASRFTSFRDVISKTRNNPNYGKPAAWHTPVKEAISRVNVDALKQDALAKQEERALQRKLALSLIDIGFKALASKLHPDKGGSREAMVRLNRVRELLQQAVPA